MLPKRSRKVLRAVVPPRVIYQATLKEREADRIDELVQLSFDALMAYSGREPNEGG